jgi:hypothetical protein
MRGRPPGATKGDTKAGVVRFRCDLARKGEWVRKARKAGKSLTQWLTDLANDA